MNVKRFLVAVTSAFLLALVLDIVINAVLMRHVWAIGAICLLPTSEMNRLVPLGWFSMLLVITFQGMIFVRSRWQGIGRGLEFGLWLAGASFVGVVGGMGSIVAWPRELILAMAVQQVINNLVTGLSLGWLYRSA